MPSGRKPGTPNKASYMRLELQKAYGFDEAKAILDRVYMKVMQEGDVAAAKLWLEYVVGKPAATDFGDIDMSTVGEIKVTFKHPDLESEESAAS